MSHETSGPLFRGLIELSIEVSLAATGWQTALRRTPRVVVLDRMPDDRPPGVVSIPLEGQAIPVKRFAFAVPTTRCWSRSPHARREPETGLVHRRAGTASSMPLHALPERRTRIRPPGDCIKLEDRLYFLLQPPLESLLASEELRFPLNPFAYQLEGVAFLYPRHQAILADEMGLGKTMQAITAIRLLARRSQLRRVLLVCPKPVVNNWLREFARWAPELPVVVLEGDPERRRWLWRLPEAVVTIANYELIVRDHAMLFEGRVHFDLVVLDESQRIKNRTSATNRFVCGISRRRSWALTGTPVENGPQDLVGIFEFLAPGYLNPDMTPRRMGRAVSDYILRRTKDQVLDDLPPKLLRDAEVELTDAQRESYRLAEKEGIVRLSALGDELTIQHVFELILRLKQICNFDPLTGASAKLERLNADLEECAASGRKALVFSQWVNSLQKLGHLLERFGPRELHGRVPPRQRDAVIDQFRDDPRSHVLLLSYGVGGVGLNLQFAGYVFLFDRWWNPAIEDQAINRAHRIGTRNPVIVTRLLAADTIEQRIQEILDDKRAITETIFSGTQPARGLGLSQEEMFGLFGLKPPDLRLRRAA